MLRISARLSSRDNRLGRRATESGVLPFKMQAFPEQIQIAFQCDPQASLVASLDV